MTTIHREVSKYSWELHLGGLSTCTFRTVANCHILNGIDKETILLKEVTCIEEQDAQKKD